MMGRFQEVLLSALIVSLLCFCCSHANSLCPSVPDCFCHEVAPSSENDQNYIIINCTERNLSNVPRFASLSGQEFDYVLLNNNNIESIYSRAFIGLQTIKKLDLSNNEIHSASDNAFDQLDSLEELDISNARLTSAPVGIGTLVNLRKLDLHNNKINSLPNRAFQNLCQLRYLDLSQNNIQITGSFNAFDNLISLEYLNLGSCDIYNVPSEILYHTPNLTTLILSKNNIEQFLPDVFERLPKLVRLELEDNPIPLPMSETVFHGLTKVTHLTLGGCTLEKLQPITFRDMRKLEHLVLRDCGIEEIEPGVFNDFKHIKYLDLSSNDFLLEESILAGTYGNVETLKLNDLRMREVPIDILSKYPKLKNIYMNENFITGLKENQFQGLKQSNVNVYLKENRIDRISSQVLEGARRPLNIYLSGNFIRDISFLTKSHCKFHGAVLDLSENPITCNCDTFELAQKKSFDLRGRCSAPNTFKNLILKWQPGLSPRDDYLEKNRDVVKECVGTDRSDQRYDCACGQWLDFDSPQVCAMVDAAESNTKNMAMFLAAILVSLSASLI